MTTVAQNLQSIIDTKAAIKEAIEDVTGEAQSDVFATYPDKIEGMADISDSRTFGHVVNGKWVKPAEWDDIESMELDDEHDTIYLLYRLVGERYKYASLLVTRVGTVTYSYGHVSNGVYTIHQNCTEQTSTGSSNLYIYYDFSSLQDDYIVIRIQSAANVINRVSTNSTGASTFPGTDMNNLTERMNPCVMRYGNMPRGTNILFRAYSLESDNIVDFAKYWQNTTTGIAMAEAYNSCFNLQRWRCTGWDIPKNKVTSFANMFAYCFKLYDVARDFSGWVTSNTTTVASMFSNCIRLDGYLDFSNWDVTNITTFNSLVGYNHSISKIIGLETWTNARKCINVGSMFVQCYLLKQDIDLSKLEIGKGNIASLTIGNMFGNCGMTSLNISGWDMSKATSFSVNSCSFLRKIIVRDTIFPKNLTSCNQMFYYNRVLESIYVYGLDCKTNAVAAAAFFGYLSYQNYSLRRCEFVDCVFPDNISIDDNTNTNGYLFFNNYNLEYLDVRDMDFSIFTGTMAHLYAFRSCYKLVDFYPPKNLSKNLNITGDYSLSHESLQRIITNLVDLSGQTSQNIAMGTYNIAKLTQADMDAMAAKNWTYSAS